MTTSRPAGQGGPVAALRPVMVTLVSSVPLEQGAVASLADRVAAQHPQLVSVANKVRPMHPPRGYEQRPAQVMYPLSNQVSIPCLTTPTAGNVGLGSHCGRAEREEVSALP
jgi:hypothetical protein